MLFMEFSVWFSFVRLLCIVSGFVRLESYVIVCFKTVQELSGFFDLI